MSDAPDFRELVGEDAPAEEARAPAARARAAVAAGPPPELPPQLAGAATRSDGARRTSQFLPRRRTGLCSASPRRSR